MMAFNDLFSPIVNSADVDSMEIYTPTPKPSPRLNGPLVFGCRPKNPFLYRIPCQGERPINFEIAALPAGLSLDSQSGIISGSINEKGEFDILITAHNPKGSDSRSMKIISGDKLALTPPMGWNHWYAHYDRITDSMIREAANIMISSGMADVGYSYVNIDDCWMNAPKNSDPMRVGPLRDGQGNILPNRHFPDMKGLTDYIHSIGLKAGLYTSPGPLTCGGFAGSYQHEEQDARHFAEWGFDFLKYDWCSYDHVANGGSSDDKTIPLWDKKTTKLDKLKYPYKTMGDFLKNQNRDIVFNLCQYGMGDVWQWGGEVGGHCWRTSGDLGFELDRIFEVALKNSEHRLYSKPGEWNDPDYIQIGYIGNAGKMGIPELTSMPPAMQYAYMSMWCLMASPLIYSGDMTRLDEFTLNVLCNPEVIGVNQDPLGEAAEVFSPGDMVFMMKKNMADGSIALGIFNKGKNAARINVDLAKHFHLKTAKIRDLWKQKDLGEFQKSFSTEVPSKGVVMIKLASG
jgi:alpha-galactosidase